jgi:cell wall-associated NlpC family hydrolase
MRLKIGSIALLGLMLGQAPAAHADNGLSSGVYVDGHALALPAAPVVVAGRTLVPMRAVFEAQNASVEWSNASQTVSAAKDGITFTYKIGEQIAYRNGERLELSQPGQLIDSTVMVPLRFVSEALGSLVQWHAYSGEIAISTSDKLPTTVTYGVNLRSSPESGGDSPVARLLAKDEKIQVLREIDARWLEVRTQDDRIGFISAKPRYTDYRSAVLASLQGEALISFGKQYLGTPYEFGAESGRTAAFDCSSFVQHVFREVLDIDLPRVSYNQAKEGKAIELNELRVGDLLFFKARGLDIGHVGIYAGDNQILHTFSKEKGVHLAEFDDKWKKRFVAARRIF